ncbi:MAG: hypothetical protein HYV32_02585 [Candidatus Kerfeldbacteria bacterium]|nr:hypothetical protein [Candidatus Kerfeldbacteria bacterium]
MDEKEKELIELMKEWKDEVKGIATDYNTAIATLDENNKKWWVVYKPFIITIISFFFLIFGFIIVSKTTQWCELTMSFPNGVVASSRCE